MPDQKSRLRQRVLTQRQIALADAVASADALRLSGDDDLSLVLSGLNLGRLLAGRPVGAVRYRQALAARAEAQEAIKLALAALVAVEDLMSKRHGPC